MQLEHHDLKKILRAFFKKISKNRLENGFPVDRNLAKTFSEISNDNFL